MNRPNIKAIQGHVDLGHWCKPDEVKSLINYIEHLEENYRQFVLSVGKEAWAEHEERRRSIDETLRNGARFTRTRMRPLS